MIAIGDNYRMFSNRVFGVWVRACIKSIGPKYITVQCYFHGNEWTEKVPKGWSFYDSNGFEVKLETK